MLFLVVSAVAALAVYAYFTDSDDQDDQDDRPPSYSYEPPPPQPPLCHCDENQQTIDPPRKVDAPVEVVASGTSLREKANGEGDLMNLYYQQSKQAYQLNNHTRGKALKEQGKRHEFNMKNLHAKASASIYEENNWDKPAGEVDLHGLRVKEAIAYSEKAIEEARRRGDSEIRLIVGKGTRSTRGVSRLKPAIQERVRQDRIPVEVDLKNPGVLIVRVGGR